MGIGKKISRKCEMLLVELTGELFKPGSLRGQTLPTAHQLAYLAQVSRQAGIDADYYQARPLFNAVQAFYDPERLSFPNPLSQDEIIQDIESYAPSLVAFGMMYYQIPDTIRVAKALKKRTPKLKIIAGGYGPSAYPEILLDHPGIFDFFIQGNSFATLPSLAKQLLNFSSQEVANKLLDNRDHFLLEHRLINDEEKERFGELSDKVSRSAFAMLDEHDNVLLFHRIREDNEFNAWTLEPVLQKSEYAGVSGYVFPINVPQQRSYNITASFGCGFNCTYCSTPAIFGAGKKGLFSNRFRDPKKVLSEIAYLAKHAGANTFFFTDPNFNFDGSFVFSICSELIKGKQEGTIPQQTFFYAMLTPFGKQQRFIHAFPISKEEAKTMRESGKWEDPSMTAFELMKAAGFGRVAFGAESFSDSQLRDYGRLNSIDDLTEYNMAAQRAGIATRNFYFLSHKDNLADLHAAEEVIAKSAPSEIRIAHYVPALESLDGRAFFSAHLGQTLSSGFKVTRRGVYDIFGASDAGHNITGIKDRVSTPELERIRREIARGYYSSEAYRDSINGLLLTEGAYADSIEYFRRYLESQGLKQ